MIEIVVIREDVYSVSVREVLQEIVHVCHEDGFGWSSCCVMSVGLLSLEKK